MAGQAEAQSASAVLMIRPTAFCDNPQTRLSNPFQSGISDTKRSVTARVCAEFDSLVDVLQSNGVVTYVFEGRTQRDAPDEVFPNNWVSTHADGTVVLYPMMAGNRRHERRSELFKIIDSDTDYHTTRMIDLTAHERHHRYLEGTGSLVLDRINRIAYANLSPRTHLDALEDFSKQLGYEIVSFEATDDQERPIYHTNVLMSVGTGFAVICSEAIKARTKRARVLESLRSSGREVIEVRRQQLTDFPANLLELVTPDGPAIALSSRAWGSLDKKQRGALARHGRIVTSTIPTIERMGGGSVRCMLAEIHLPH